MTSITRPHLEERKHMITQFLFDNMLHIWSGTFSDKLETSQLMNTTYINFVRILTLELYTFDVNVSCKPKSIHTV